MRTLALDEMLAELCCPACGAGLRPGPDDERAVICAACARAYPRRHGVVSFVLQEQLDATARREIAGNRIDLQDAGAVGAATRKKGDDPVYQWQMARTAAVLERMMACYPPETLLCTMGTGCGFDLQLVLARTRFERVLASDISIEKCAVVPASLERFDGALGVFASSFSACPLRARPGMLGLVFQALHHAADPHAALEGLLERGFDDLIIVEPLTNWLIEILAAFGLARRVEYSGLRPDWLSLARMRGIASAARKRLECVTWWELPPACSAPALRRRTWLWRPMCAAAAAASRITDLARFGCMAAIHFRGITSRAAARPSLAAAA
jgi:hypothetical protein